MFNPSMNSLMRDQYMTKISREQLLNYNYNGYPRINMDTNELEWWDFTTEYNKRMAENTTAQAGLAPAVATAPTATQP